MTDKKRNILIVITFIFLIIVVYELAIIKTIEYRDAYKSSELLNISSINQAKDVEALIIKNNCLDSILGKDELHNILPHNSLLVTLTNYCDSNGLRVISFFEPHSYGENDLAKVTYRFIVEGSYINSARLIRLLEQEHNYGEIVSVNFNKNKDHKKKFEYLTTEILLQKLMAGSD